LNHQKKEVLKVLFINHDKERYLAALELFCSQPTIEYDMTWCQDLDMSVEAMLAPIHDIIFVNFDKNAARARDLLKSAVSHHCQTPVICTAKSEAVISGTEAIKLGAADFINLSSINTKGLERSISFAIERKQAHQELTKLAHYDVLTGIPNRSLFSDRLDRALQRSVRGDTPFAILFIDLEMNLPSY